MSPGCSCYRRYFHISIIAHSEREVNRKLQIITKIFTFFYSLRNLKKQIPIIFRGFGNIKILKVTKLIPHAYPPRPRRGGPCPSLRTWLRLCFWRDHHRKCRGGPCVRPCSMAGRKGRNQANRADTRSAPTVGEGFSPSRLKIRPRWADFQNKTRYI